MIDREKLLKDLKGELPKIEADILDYSKRHAELGQHLEAEYQKAVEAGRTAEHFVTWREAQITQAAAAWVLTCVFVRFLEDNGLLDEPVLSGPVARADGSRLLAQAKERITHHFGEHPAHAEREYLLALFRELDQLPVLDALLDPRHNPLWQIPVSDDGAKRLVDFFQRIDPESGELVHDFTDAEWDTRFLGDLYQDLSEAVRKRYALLQTPEFVEEFILDYTLSPAIETFGLEGLRLIDPTCGSGHFLLTTFERVFDAWQRREPATNARNLAQRALDVVHGVDINPYAIAVAKFRLLIAALKAAGTDKIRNAPDFDFHLAVGDSLLHGKRHESQGQGLQLDTFDDSLKHAFETEDLNKLNQILGQRYHVVVGNPPYITVKDKVLNQAYRDKYPTCHMKYSLGVPFTERFFDLTMPTEDSRPAGYVGLITANSFMKREFGKKLIEEYLPEKDLTHVVDTSGAYIPGHGTPTVILLARNRFSVSNSIRAVLGVRGEPSTPVVARFGKVWQSIKSLLECPGSGNEFVTVADQERSFFVAHPWSLSGGGASEVKELIVNNSSSVLRSHIRSIGFSGITGEDNVYVVPRSFAHRAGLRYKKFSDGESIRDWGVTANSVILFPYEKANGGLFCKNVSRLDHYWRCRSILRARKMFGKSPFEHGANWGELIYLSQSRLFSDYLISFAFVSTHNNFILSDEERLFKQSSPVIMLKESAERHDYLCLLGLLNSSVACFWMKQVFHNKGATSDKGILQDDPERFRFEFDGAKLKEFPVPSLSGEQKDKLLSLSEALHRTGKNLSEFDFFGYIESFSGSELREALNREIERREKDRRLMVRWQEELDWLCYEVYGLFKAETNERCRSLIWSLSPEEVEPLDPDERTYRFFANGVVEGGNGRLDVSRVSLIKESRILGLIERPEYKRRWFRSAGAYNANNLSDEILVKRALKEWLLNRLEEEAKANGPELLTGAQLADRVRHDDKFQQVGELYTDNSLFDAQQLVTGLIAVDEVPQMAASRLKPASIKKFRAWQETWDKQRLEDAIDAEFGVAEPLSPEDAENADKVKAYEAAKKQAEAKKAAEVGTIPVPPKYASTDFRKSSYWSLRGKLDVPKERFFSLPGCEKPGDSTPVIGWAGLDHLQRAQAIAGWYMERKDHDGWEADKLMPMLVALEELIPWLKQWHNALDPEYGERMGDFYEGFLFEELRRHDLTRDDLLAWQPPAAQRGRRRKTTSA